MDNSNDIALKNPNVFTETPQPQDETTIEKLESSLVNSQEKDGPHSASTQKIIVELIKALNKAALNLFPSPASPRKPPSTTPNKDETVVSEPSPKVLARHHLEKVRPGRVQ